MKQKTDEKMGRGKTGGTGLVVRTEWMRSSEGRKSGVKRKEGTGV